MAISYPKRTLKKSINRDKLLATTTLLFSRKGYPHTTLDAVAAEAGVHVQTLYKHFKNKEELAVAAADLVTRDLEKRFEEKFASRSTFKIWHSWVKASVSHITQLGFGEYKKQALHTSTSLIHDNYLLIIYASYENILTEYLGKDFQLDLKTNRLPRLVACMLCSGNEAALKRCAGQDTDEDVLEYNERVISESLAVIDDVEKIFASYVKYPRD